MSSSIED